MVVVSLPLPWSIAETSADASLSTSAVKAVAT